MSSIHDLLNPLPNQRFPFVAPSPPLVSMKTPRSYQAPVQKIQKVKDASEAKDRSRAKDGPSYKPRKVRGEVRYAPCEERDEELERIHRQFQVYPMGNIADYPTRIPYNSDKRSFGEGTGRDYLEVFHFEYKTPGDPTRWILSWDYNIGLVRVTHLFRSLGHGKTTVGRAMRANVGLPEISHSLTGGATYAQGYWMPYEAAKALAATFCWNIRHVLTPIFGRDFPSLCVHPQSRAFNNMVIDPSIIKRAAATANHYRSLELSPPLSAFNPSPSIRPVSSSGGSLVAARKKAIPRSRKHADSLSSTATASSGTSSGYGSGVDEYPDVYCVSPLSMSSYQNVNTFTPVNTPRSADVLYPSAGSASTSASIPTPQEVLASITAKVTASTVIVNEDSAGTTTGTDEETRSSSYSEISSPQSDWSFVDLDKEEYRDKSPTSEPMPASRKRKAESNSLLLAREVKAAHALLSLHMQDASGSDDEGSSSPSSSVVGIHQQQQQHASQGRKRRRASA